jgi:hypothetical protein
MSTFTEQRETAARPEAEHTLRTGPGPLERPTRRVLLGVVVVLIVALVGLSAWTIVDRTSTADTAVTEEIQQLLDDYHIAWNTWDGDAYRALVTEDGVHVIPGRTMSAAQQAIIVDGLERVGWHVEVIGEPIMTGDGPWYVAQANLLTANTYPDEGLRGLSTFTIVDEDGTLRISRHVYTGEY